MPRRLNKLGNAYQLLFECFERPDDVDKAVDCFVRAVISTPDGDPDKPGYLSNLGSTYHLLLKCHGRFDVIDKAIRCKEQAIALIPDKVAQLNSLGELYLLLFSRSNLPRDAGRALDSFKHAALMSTGPPSVRLRASNSWAQVSTSLGLSPLEPYMRSLELLPQVVGLGTSIVDQYQSLAADTRDLVTEAAAEAISMQQHDLALEWLEQGRCLVWNQLLELRTPFDDLRAAHPGVAGELQEASHLLESASMSESIEQEVSRSAESLLDVAEKHRLVAKHWEQLTASVRSLPGFANFLRAQKASELIRHVQDGAAVILNQMPGLLMYQKAEDARTQLAKCLRSRDTRHPVWIDGDESQTPFQDILAMLWYDVVKPVLDHLCATNKLPAGEIPHITWCITGPLSFLPLHAAGDYISPATILPNLAVSSYTPNISSLSRSNPTPNIFSGILLVGHSSSIRELSALPGTTAELDQVQKQFKDLQCTRLSEQDACTDPVLRAMTHHSWVHFACHASQDPYHPLKSALHLHDKDLDLATISRNPMTNAQLAFLSACQTATGDLALPDEAMHLAAGLLMTGYPAVVATMWSINDTDAPVVAGKVYECLLEGGVPDSRRVAVALHKATAHLRNTTTVDNFARWVPYIHIGR